MSQNYPAGGIYTFLCLFLVQAGPGEVHHDADHPRPGRRRRGHRQDGHDRLAEGDAISGEYSSGMIATTLTAIPRRLTVLVAKAVVVTGLTLAAGAAGVLASVLAGRLLLPGHGFTTKHGYSPLSLASGPDLRAAVGSVLYLALIALLALGAATAVRDAAVSMGGGARPDLPFPRHRQRAGARLVTAPGADRADDRRALHPGHHRSAQPPAHPWQGLGVLALWAAGSLLTGGLVLWRRDA
jgi:ABC-2 type transport system permease protein